MNRLNEDVQIEKVGNGLIINKKNRLEILYLSEIEVEIFQLLIKKSLLETIKTVLMNYEGETIEEDIMAFYNELIEKEILLSGE